MKTIEEMAWEYALRLEPPPVEELENFARYCFGVAEAMQAEAEKRKAAPNADPMRKVREAECQPDWSQAPDDAVAWVYSNVDKSGFWCHKKPIRLSRGWCTSTMLKKAPSFNYQGDWKDSLRKRP